MEKQFALQDLGDKILGLAIGISTLACFILIAMSIDKMPGMLMLGGLSFVSVILFLVTKSMGVKSLCDDIYACVIDCVTNSAHARND